MIGVILNKVIMKHDLKFMFLLKFWLRFDDVGDINTQVRCVVFWWTVGCLQGFEN
jgi:hypothetical protein